MNYERKESIPLDVFPKVPSQSVDMVSVDYVDVTLREKRLRIGPPQDLLRGASPVYSSCSPS